MRIVAPVVTRLGLTWLPLRFVRIAALRSPTNTDRRFPDARLGPCGAWRALFYRSRALPRSVRLLVFPATVGFHSGLSRRYVVSAELGARFYCGGGGTGGGADGRITVVVLVSVRLAW